MMQCKQKKFLDAAQRSLGRIFASTELSVLEFCELSNFTPVELVSPSSTPSFESSSWRPSNANTMSETVKPTYQLTTFPLLSFEALVYCLHDLRAFLLLFPILFLLTFILTLAYTGDTTHSFILKTYVNTFYFVCYKFYYKFGCFYFMSMSILPSVWVCRIYVSGV